MFFSSIALAKMYKINTMFFEEEGVQKIENRCLCYSIIEQRHTVTSNVIKIQLSDSSLEIIKMVSICLHIQYHEHDKLHI